jgi:fructokinase
MDFELDTGKVIATPGEDGAVHYDFCAPVAWDNIHWDDHLLPLVSDAQYFIHGTLAVRAETSRRVLYRLLEVAPARVFDINLRPPHYDRAVLEHLLPGTALLKLNLDELELLTGWFSGFRRDEDRMEALQDRFHIPTVVVTRGGEGAVLLHEGEFYAHPGFRVEVADTVGSGDAFLAGLLFQLAQGTDPPDAITFASAMGALVASQSGPTPAYRPADIERIMKQ